MTSVKISYEKYAELYTIAVSEKASRMFSETFDNMFNCTVPRGGDDHGIELYFDSEKDAMFFRLRWL